MGVRSGASRRDSDESRDAAAVGAGGRPPASSGRAYSAATANPSDSACAPNFNVVTPRTRPDVSSNGPPLLPGLMAASVCRNVIPPTWRMPLMMPRVTVFSRSPRANPMAITS